MADNYLIEDDEDPVLGELRAIRVDLRSARRWRQAFGIVLVVLTFVVATLVGLAINAFQQRHELSNQNTRLAAVVNANDYDSCIRGNETRMEIKAVLSDLVINYVMPESKAQDVLDRLNDPTSALAPRDCTTLPR